MTDVLRLTTAQGYAGVAAELTAYLVAPTCLPPPLPIPQGPGHRRSLGAPSRPLPRGQRSGSATSAQLSRPAPSTPPSGTRAFKPSEELGAVATIAAVD